LIPAKDTHVPGADNSRMSFFRFVFFLALPALAAAAQPLQPYIDATPDGGVRRLSPGDYSGPARIDRPITLDGGGKARLVGNGRGTVLAVETNGATVKGLAVAGSGESHDGVDAGILVAGDDNRIEDNVLTDVLFGIHVRGGNRNTVARNRVTGKDLPVAQRGDALRMWHGRHNRIEDNRFRRARDLTFTNSPDNRVAGNTFVDGRYGMHIVFSPRLAVERNVLEHTGTGIVILYSPDILVRGNRVAHALTGGGGGIVFKDSGNGRAEDNEIVHCSTGLQIDAPPESVGLLQARNNRFAHNIVGAYFYGEAGGHRFENNRFENNLTPIAISAVGAGSANTWSGNFWSQYQGFDRNGDGVGDSAHEEWLYADRIWMETPKAAFFRASPVLELLDFLERLAPFSAPHRILRDPAPRMR
jgi:nitrous oxidase accessory protein